MNPNSNRATTREMAAIASTILPDVQGWTAPDGPGLLTSMTLLDAAAAHVAAAEIPDAVGGIIVCAFGDPGRAALAARLDIPVIGIGESAAIAAASGGRRYAVVTHTPGLVSGIDMLMRTAAPSGAYLGTFLTDGDPVILSADEDALDAALLAATHRAHSAGAQAVIIGGGPLGQSAERLRPLAPCDLIAPIPEAARRMLRIMEEWQ
ncbi:aspartate/glutamate racemase family protein [Yoonia vestfoldensis]|uniref:Asp/Glu racemase n=1 Tax=Yoonia vestfoldensis SKA53 TaxID=314232 RepID=A3V8V3_9RHOB|nr:aspartate/glutamate racemase family protein [Yoonia vestfoldensis]EAQ05316.1 hypothetical protein SKA53_00030 [Yoonia vestfoldensis SKA53]